MTTTKLLTEQVTESRTAPTGGATGNSELCFVTKARVNQGNHQCTKRLSIAAFW